MIFFSFLHYVSSYEVFFFIHTSYLSHEFINVCVRQADSHGTNICLWVDSNLMSCVSLQAPWGFHGPRACSAPALPADRITALQAVDFWTKQFEGKGVSEPELSSRYITAYLLGAKTVSRCLLSLFQESFCRFSIAALDVTACTCDPHPDGKS